MIKVPCRGCKNRVPATKETPSCHASCPLYTEYLKAQREEYDQRKKKGVIDVYEAKRSFMIAKRLLRPTYPNRKK